MKATDADFARVALAKGLISRERHDRVLAEADRLQALGLEKSVDEILVERGDITNEHARSLREALGWTVTRPRIGGYEIIRRVGIGGMGTVFEARQVRLNQRIALKVLFPRLAKDPRLTDRFLREARTLARLDHQHLVHAIDAGQDGEYFYLAMELIEGENLLQRLARAGPLDPLSSLDVVRSVCEALGVLEEKGLVHRDVKPGNILMGSRGQVKLADLGLFKGLDGSKDDQVCGTPHYMAPEQIRGGEDVDTRTDLYSLGATWYHMVVGRPPFVGTRTVEILDAQCTRDPPLPSRLRPGLPAAMERVILRWLSKEKEARPRDARAALREIDELDRSLRGRRWGALWRKAALGLRSRPRALLATAGGGVIAFLVLLSLSMIGRGRSIGPEAESPMTRESAADPAVSMEDPPQIRDDAGPPTRAGDPLPDAAIVSRTPVARTPVEDLDLPAATAPGPEGAGIMDLLGRLASVLDERTSAAWSELSARSGNADPLLRFSRTFHAAFVGVEPGRSPPAGIVLRYSFDSAHELLDFRATPGTWEVREGELRGLAGPEGAPLESVAWFTPPVRIEWELPLEAPCILGFGSLRIAPGGAVDARVWSDGPDGDISVLAAPRVAPGRGWIHIDAGGVEIAVGGRIARVKTRAPSRGRVTLRIASARTFSELVLEAVLEPSWSQGREETAREPR